MLIQSLMKRRFHKLVDSAHITELDLPAELVTGAVLIAILMRWLAE